VFKDVTAWHRI